MNWTIEYSDDPEAFEARVRDYLLEDEALHNVALGVLRTLQQNPNYYSGDNMLACVHDDGTVGGVVTRTPPFPGLLSRAVDEDAVSAMVDALLDTYPDLDGIIGPAESVEIAVRRLEDLGFESNIGQRQRLYRTTTVEPPTGVAGEMRSATPAPSPRPWPGRLWRPAASTAFCTRISTMPPPTASTPPSATSQWPISICTS